MGYSRTQRMLPAPWRQNGFTLLEVLVACGILVVALGGIAAILPAAGSVLSDANGQLRATTLATNALAELRSRRLLSADVFAPGRASARIGWLIATASEDLDGDGELDTGEDGNGNGRLDAPPSLANMSVVDGRIDRTRGFQLEDEIIFSPPGSSPLPGNSFIKNGTAGVREYRDGTCWGAMLFSDSPSPSAGTPALLSIAVFKKVPTSVMVSLYASESTALGERRMLALFDGDVQKSATPATLERRLQDESNRKRLLRPGTAILLGMAASATQSPWVRVTSSWTEQLPDRKSFVMLESAPPAAAWSAGPGTTVVVSAICFENLLRLEEQGVVLE